MKVQRWLQEPDLSSDQASYNRSPLAVQSPALVYVVPAIKKMYHADQFSIALCVSDY